jgi:hypothetical protein
MFTSYRTEDDIVDDTTLRRIIEYNECENMKCGVTVTVVIPLMLKQKGLV